MEKKKLMPVSLLILTLCTGFICCVRPGSISIDLDISTFQGPQPLSRESTPGQFDSSHTSSEERRGSNNITSTDGSSHTSLEERRGSNNITSTEEVKIRGQPSKKKTSRKRGLKQLENGEMRGRKIPKVSNGSTDDNGQYNGSSSFQGPTLNETPVPKIVSYNGQRAGDKKKETRFSRGEVNSVRGRAEKGFNSHVLRNRRRRRMKSIKKGEQLNKEGRESEKQEKEGESEKDGEMESQRAERWLCKHYNRRCRVRFPCCTQFYPCHRCHNSANNCKNDEAKECHATHLKCSLCHFEQEIDENSAVCSRCGEKMAEYFCYDCKSFKSVSKNPYHCEQCGICRIFKDKMYHCEGCNVCLKKRLEGQHKCKANSGHDLCSICFEDVFRSCHVWKCGHKEHRKCAADYILHGGATCPMCRQPLLLPSH